MENKKLRLGLDLGTTNVGWALLDENNQIVQKNGFSFWGVRMFDEALTAKKRRGYRGARRRINRRNIYRLDILREFFAPEICAIDPTFFERLDDSFYKLEDKKHQNIHNLFTTGYTDKEFFSEYPTIYHLRKALMENDKKFDIRMIFLALNNMMKHRGNFLTEGALFNVSDYSRVKEVFENLNIVFSELSNEFSEEESYEDDYYENIVCDDSLFKGLNEILLSRKGIKDKKKELLDLFGVNKKSLVNELLIPFLTSSKVNFSKLSLVSAQKYDSCEIDLKSEALEEQIENGKNAIPELASLFDCVLDIKSVVDYYFVLDILKDSHSISEAMVNIYDNHQVELKKLKEFLKQYNKDKYIECFKTYKDKLNNYVAYVGMNDVSGEMKRFKHCKREDFYKYLIDIFKDIKDESAQEEILEFTEKINNNKFLLKQRSDQNGAIPMQLHLSELKAILNNQKKYYQFLNTLEEKIIAVFKFRIPYYVGVLNENSKHSWVIKNNNDKITPWNLDSVVNMGETAKQFIQRMQNKCTYLKGDDDYCLPKFSLVFSEYNCLSYLNKININGSLISNDLKMKIFENVFLKIKQPTKKNILEYIKSEYGSSNPFTSTGKELPEVTCNMASTIKFKEIFGNKFNSSKDMIEDIIRDITIFEDKKILENRLREKYGLENEIIKRIKDLNYKGYGRLSMRLLNGLRSEDKNTGEVYGTIIEIMRNTNMNLQEIIFDKTYRFNELIDSYNRDFLSDDKQELNDFIDENISVSPLIKRSIIQAYTIINEIENILGRKIDEYYVECTRTNKAKKQATTSRYENVKNLYKECNDIAIEGVNIGELKKKLEENKDKLKSDKIYFYFTQLGKCMYTLKNIDFDDVIHGKKLDIDHIYPQAIIKDDSLTNRVLVLSNENNRKDDMFLFEIPGILNNNAPQFYEKLLSLGLISKGKYLRLTKKELAENELDTFINRQLVSTNQSVKGLINVLKYYKKIDEKNIIYSKAENVSDFRKKYDLVKSRLANNFHHAHDAYLNVIVGSVLNTYYNKYRYNSFKDYERIKNDRLTVNVDKIMEKPRIEINNKVIWDQASMLTQIKYDLYKRFDVNETIRTYNSNEMFKKVTIAPVGSDSLIPVKNNVDIKKYGGITSYSYSKYIIVDVTNKKGKKETHLVAIPKNSENDIDKYLKELEYENYLLVHNNIKTNVVIEEGKLKYCITGKMNDTYLIKNLNDRYFNYREMLIIKKIEKYLENKKFNNNMEITDDYIIIAPAKNDKCKEIRLEKSECLMLFETMKKHFNKIVYSYNAIDKIAKKLNLESAISKRTIDEIIKLLDSLLGLLKTNERKTVDLISIGLPKNAGTLYISKNLKKGMKFISESITGYYRKVLYEVK